MRQIHYNQDLGGWCLIQSGNSLVNGQMSTYRLNAEQFATMESSFASNGQDFEESIEQTKLNQNTINYEYMQIFFCEHDTGGLDVF